MGKITKIAELKVADTKNLNQIVKALENNGFTIVYDAEFEQYVYVCIKNSTK